jgi:hypothetical protein
MPCVGFKCTIPASERAKTVHALDRSATVTGRIRIQHIIIQIIWGLCCPSLLSCHADFVSLRRTVKRITSGGICGHVVWWYVTQKNYVILLHTSAHSSCSLSRLQGGCFILQTVFICLPFWVFVWRRVTLRHCPLLHYIMWCLETRSALAVGK